MVTAPLWLVVVVCVIAAVYASVGLGGATSYAALFSLTAIPYAQIPALVLTLNLLASGCAFWGRSRARLMPPASLRPLILGSVPAAFLGGLLPIREREFAILLAVVLGLAALRFLFGRTIEARPARADATAGRGRTFRLVLLGVGLGLLAGMTGIGGGVYLGPILILTGWGDLRTTPGVTSGFVFLNSLAGLAAHMLRLHPVAGLWIPLAAAVLLGGAAGTMLSLRRPSAAWTQRALGLALLAVAVLNGAKAL